MGRIAKTTQFEQPLKIGDGVLLSMQRGGKTVKNG